MKQCSKCGELKDLNEFGLDNQKKDKLRPSCRSCKKKTDALGFKNNKNKRLARNKEYYEENKAKLLNSQRDYYNENKKIISEKHKVYIETESGKKAKRKAGDNWTKANLHKKETHYAVHKAVKSGELHKPNTCTLCGCFDVKIEGHHYDYSKPLDVVWCCSKCHAKIHHSKDNTWQEDLKTY